MIERCYDLGGTILSLRTDDSQLCAGIDTLLRDNRVAAGGEDSYTVWACFGRVGEPGGDLVYEGPLPDDGHCVMRRSGDVTHLTFPGRQSLALSPAERRAQVIVDPAAGEVAWTIWMMVIDAALDATGRCLVHAAGLRVPGTDAAVLVHAPSGAGKTTTALALARDGFALLSDDVVAVGRKEPGWTAWGLPRGINVHRQTAAMLPFVGPVLSPEWDANDEQAVALTRLRELVRTEPATLRIAALLHLSRGTGKEAVVRPASRVDVFASLAADNVRTGRTGLLPQHRRRLDLLGKLAAAVPVFRLEVGNDLIGLGDTVLQALSGSADVASRSG